MKSNENFMSFIQNKIVALSKRGMNQIWIDNKKGKEKKPIP
jgi:hypothetical protein